MRKALSRSLASRIFGVRPPTLASCHRAVLHSHTFTHYLLHASNFHCSDAADGGWRWQRDDGGDPLGPAQQQPGPANPHQPVRVHLRPAHPSGQGRARHVHWAQACHQLRPGQERRALGEGSGWREECSAGRPCSTALPTHNCSAWSGVLFLNRGSIGVGASHPL